MKRAIGLGAVMTRRLVGMGAIAMTIAAVPPLSERAGGQQPQKPAKADRSYVQPRTPDGQPDLQGVWTNATLTPLERPADLAGKELLTRQEAADYQQRVLARWDRDNRGGGPETDLGRAYGSVWWDADARLVPMTRTSLLVAPPDGKLPPLTAAAQQRIDASRIARQQHPADGPEDRPLMDRCLWWPAVGPPMLPSFANNSPYSPLVSNYQFLQGPGYVAIVNEILHETRMVPLDGRPHLSQKIRKWMGDSRGRWDGNTLVIDTTNFTAKSQFRGTGEQLHLVERLTRTDVDDILYEFTVDDPASFTRPWSASIPMIKSQDPIFENACHEGNYGLRFLLGIARWEENTKEAAAR
ncbi:MAG: hypothetical protein ABJA98_23165 [Acidobacteriota bacterium]